jgi:Cft2 family RNA processing exonuclease
MSDKISFVAYGGADFIGGTHYGLRVNDVLLGVDCGAYPEDNELGKSPKLIGSVKNLLLTHGHFDHVGLVPVLVRRNPDIKIWASLETIELSRILWAQTDRIAKANGLAPIFSEGEVEAAYKACRELPTEEPLLINGLSIFAIPAGHILGARSFLITTSGGDKIFITGDISFRDRSLIKGAPKIQTNRTRLLIRESTYINEVFEKTREQVITDFLSAIQATLARGGKVLIAALSIDRSQDMYRICCDAGIGPVFIEGSRKTFDVYRKFLPNGYLLNDAQWFKSFAEKTRFLTSNNPGIIISSSGMIYRETLSAWWAERLLPDDKSSIFMVNYQDPTGQGSALLESVRDRYVQINGRFIRRRCRVEQFEFSSHMDGQEGEEMEGRLNPDVIIYTHGNSRKINDYITARRRDGRQRLMAKAGKEIKLHG